MRTRALSLVGLCLLPVSCTGTRTEPAVVVRTAGPAVYALRSDPDPDRGPILDTLSSPRGPKLPAAGVYKYQTTLSTQASEEKGVLQVRIADAVEEPDGRSQTQRWTTGRATRDFRFLWRTDAALLEQQITSGPDGSEYRCDFDPPPPVIVLPLGVGSSWEAETACGEGISIYEGEVLRTEDVRVGGENVQTYVIRKTVRSTARPDLASVQTQWFSPDHLIAVRIEAEERSGAFTGRTVSVLQDLRPT